MLLGRFCYKARPAISYVSTLYHTDMRAVSIFSSNSRQENKKATKMSTNSLNILEMQAFQLILFTGVLKLDNSFVSQNKLSQHISKTQ